MLGNHQFYSFKNWLFKVPGGLKNQHDRCFLFFSQNHHGEMIENVSGSCQSLPNPGTLNNLFSRDVLWSNHFPSQDFESSNWNNQKQDGCAEFQDQNQKSTWNFAKFSLRIEWGSKKKTFRSIKVRWLVHTYTKFTHRRLIIRQDGTLQ